jgi:hypothetical protein
MVAVMFSYFFRLLCQYRVPAGFGGRWPGTSTPMPVGLRALAARPCWRAPAACASATSGTSPAPIAWLGAPAAWLARPERIVALAGRRAPHVRTPARRHLRRLCQALPHSGSGSGLGPAGCARPGTRCPGQCAPAGRCPSASPWPLIDPGQKLVDYHLMRINS